jgi:hypothetical protein
MLSFPRKRYEFNFASVLTYFIRRALRDCPEKVDALERGEYPSVQAMAIDAGILKKRKSVTWVNIDGLSKSLRRNLTDSEWQELIRML